MKIKFKADLKIDPRRVLRVVRDLEFDENGKLHGGTYKDILEHLGVDVGDVDVMEVLFLLAAKWKVYPKAFSVYMGGKYRTPMIRWLPRYRKPRRKTLVQLEKRTQRKRQVRKTVTIQPDPRLKGKSSSGWGM